LSQQPKNNHDTEKNSSLAAILGLALTASSASSAILVYEGFDYGPAADETRAGNALLDGQPDGVSDGVNAIGLSGVWADSTAVTATSDLYMANGSLAFGDLATSGNHVRSDTNNNNDIMSRTISATLAGTNSELWFSFTANKLQNDFSAAEGGIVIGNTTVGNARIFENDGSSGLQGFGVAPTTTGDNWTAYGWNGTTQVAGANAFSVPTNGSETNLLVALIFYSAALSTGKGLDVTGDGVKKIEVTSSMMGYRETLRFCVFEEEKAVLRIRIDNKNTRFPRTRITTPSPDLRGGRVPGVRVSWAIRHSARWWHGVGWHL